MNFSPLPPAIEKADTCKNTEDPDERWHKKAFHQGLHYLLR